MDLNICIENDGVRDSDQIIRAKLDRCSQLGFHTVALAVCIDITDKAKSQLNIPEPPVKDTLKHPKLKIYTRLTVKVNETIQTYKLNKDPATTKYDLLALCPQNSKLLQYLTAGSIELDILTFDLSDRLDFNLFKTRFKLLQTKGVCFEINYGPAQQGSSLRRNIICNGQNLVEKVSKNLILSSGVQDIFRLRSPLDAQSLGVLFMIPYKKCHEIVYKNGHMALESGKHRKSPFSSAIELIKSD